MQKSLVFVGIAILIFYLITIIINAVIRSRLDISNSPSVGVIDYINENFRQPPINQIQVIENGQPCPSQLSALLLNTWWGTDVKCNPDKNSTTKEGICFEKKGETTYTDKQIYNFENHNLCVKRVQTYTYIENGGSCPVNQRLCNAGFCVDTSEACPITSATISNSPDGSSTPEEEEEEEDGGVRLLQEEEEDVVAEEEEDAVEEEGDVEGLPDASTTSVAFGDQYLVLTTDPQEHPLYTIEVSFYGEPCYQIGAYPEDDYNTQVEGRYKLFDIGCSTYGTDERAQDLASIEMGTLLRQNNFYDIFKAIPGYEASLEGSEAYLHTREKIRIHPRENCLDRQVIDLNIYEQISRIRRTDRYLDAALAIDIILLVVSFLALLATYKNEKAFKIITVAWYLFLLPMAALSFAIFEYITDDLNPVLDVEGYNYGLADHDCFLDEVFKNAIRNFDSYVGGMKSLKEATTAYLVFGIFRLLLIVFAFIRCAYRIKKGDNKSSGSSSGSSGQAGQRFRGERI